MKCWKCGSMMENTAHETLNNGYYNIFTCPNCFAGLMVTRKGDVVKETAINSVGMSHIVALVKEKGYKLVKEDNLREVIATHTATTDVYSLIDVKRYIHSTIRRMIADALIIDVQEQPDQLGHQVKFTGKLTYLLPENEPADCEDGVCPL